jgi:serine O-acetyltransferase
VHGTASTLVDMNAEFIAKYGWDKQVDPWLDELESMPIDMPNAYRIWKSAQRYLAAGNVDRAKRCEVLIKLLHNSYIPIELQLGEDVQFGYGGMGVIVHKLCEIGDGVVIGSNVTLGGSQKPTRISPVTGRRLSIPRVEEYAYIATGAKVLGGVTVGAFAIIGANAVVTNDVPPGGIVAGQPAKLLRQLTRETVLRYKRTYLSLRKLSDEDFLVKFDQHVESTGQSPTPAELGQTPLQVSP